MNKKIIFFVILSALFFNKSFGQNSLPNITINYFNGKTVVSWLNDYEKNVTNIFIQRSFDSLKNFSTIGSVLIPQNKENGFLDNNPPYSKMFYRVSVTFEGGTYEIGPSSRALQILPTKEQINIRDTLHKIVSEGIINPIIIEIKDNKDSVIQKPIVAPVIMPTDIIQNKQNAEIKTPEVIQKAEPAYPSKKIFTNKENNIIIELEEPLINKYHIKIFDESNHFLFEINKINEAYLILDKANFFHSGWFNFELYNDEKLEEKNKFFISKDTKNNNK